jgi:hypothetical protein
MWDAVTPANILKHDKNPEIVAGYMTGTYKWTQANWNLFPNAIHVRISTQARYLVGTVLDVEPGDATPAQSVDWVLAMRAGQGMPDGANRGPCDPTLYCNRSTLVQVKAEFARRNVSLPHFWVATGSGKFELYPGSVASQYLLDWQGVDVSCVADDWPGTAPAYRPPSITRSALTPEDYDMAEIPAGTNVRRPVRCDGATKMYVALGFGEQVTGNMWFVKDTRTDGGSGGMYNQPIGQPLGQPLVIDADRPGPVAVPAGTRFVSLQTTSKVPFLAWCTND